MTFDYDMKHPEECAIQICSELRSLPFGIRENLHRLLKENPIIEREIYCPEIKCPRIHTRGLIDLSDLYDIED
jgi:hypothetical protein